VDYLRRLFDYNAWANRECAASVRAAGAPALALRVLGHIVGAEHLWLARLKDTSSPFPVWPALSVEQCASECAALGAAWTAFLTAADADRLGVAVSYVNTKGESWRSTVADILTRRPALVLPADRSSQVRAAGAEPAYGLHPRHAHGIVP
jgi:uncharacterized damage-inducible protein DinB